MSFRSIKRKVKKAVKNIQSGVDEKKSNKEAKSIFSKLPMVIDSNTLPQTWDETVKLVELYDSVNWEKDAPIKNFELHRDNRGKVYKHYVEMYEKLNKDFYFNGYKVLRYCYIKKYGVKYDSDKYDECQYKDWLCFVSTDPYEYYKEHDLLENKSDKPYIRKPKVETGLFKKFSEDCYENKFMRANYSKLEQHLLKKVNEHKDDWFYLYFCMLLEIISYRLIGIDKANSESEIKNLEQIAATQQYNIFAIFRKNIRNIFGVYTGDEEVMSRHCALTLLDVSPGDKLSKKCVQMRTHMDSIGKRLTLSAAEDIVKDYIHIYREHYLAIHKDEIEQQQKEKIKQELDKKNKDQSVQLYTEGMNLYSTAITDEQMKQGIKKISLSAKAGFVEAQRALVDILAEHGDAESQCLTGEFYLHGLNGKNKDTALAYSWFRKAARQKHPKATFYLGQAAETGFNGTKDMEQADMLFCRSGEYGFSGGMLYIAMKLIEEEKYDEAEDWLNKTAYIKKPDPSDISYMITATELLVKFTFPKDGKVNDYTHKTFLHALHYTKLKLPEINKRLEAGSRIDINKLKAIDGNYKEIDFYAWKLEKANESYMIQRAFELEALRILLKKADNGYNFNIYKKIFDLCAKDTSTHAIAHQYAKIMLDHNEPSMMLQVYYDYYGLFGYSYNERMNYVHKAATLGDVDAQNIIWIENHDRRKQEEMLRYRREQEEREAAIRRQKAIELFERKIDFLSGGYGFTVQEKYYLNMTSIETYYQQRINIDIMVANIGVDRLNSIL